MLLSIILPLAYNNGLPYVRERARRINRQRRRAVLAQAVLGEDGRLSARAAVGAGIAGGGTYAFPGRREASWASTH